VVNDFKQIIKSNLLTCLQNSQYSKSLQNLVLEIPKDKALGDFAIACFVFAKEYKKSPQIIAQDICDFLFKNPKIPNQNTTFVSKVSCVGGYVNFTLDAQFLNIHFDNALNITYKQNKTKPSQTKKILIEYVSANPTGPLHLGHIRGAVYGDALANIAKYLGYEVCKEYYVNDRGNQIALLGLSVFIAGREHILNKPLDESKLPEKYYKGEYLELICKQATQKFGEQIWQEESQDNLSQLSEFAKDAVLELIKQDLQSINIEFDNYVSEKGLYGKDGKGANDIYAMLQSNGKIYTKDNAIYLKSSEFGDDNDRVIIKNDEKNKDYTYLFSDILYHKNKYERDYDEYINIWGHDHHGYIKRLQASIEFMGYDSKKLKVLLVQMVSIVKDGKPFKLSKRDGNVILLSDVVRTFGNDSTRFEFLSKKVGVHLEFDVNMLEQKDSTNANFYINYAYVRVNALFKKANKNKDDKEVLNTTIKEEDALLLASKSLFLDSVAQEAFIKKEPHLICEYLYSLSALFNNIYHNVEVIGSFHENEYLKAFVLFSNTIKNGLSLLSITPKEEI